MRTLFIFIFGLYCWSCYSQQQSSSEILGLFSSGYAGAGAAPKVNLKTYQFTALVGKSSLDFYLYNSVPSVVPTLQKDSNLQTPEERKNNPSRRYLSNDVLQQVGGVLNLSLGKKFNFSKDSLLRDVKGGKLDIHFGGKLLEAPMEDGSKFFPSALAYFDYTYLIPLMNNTGQKKFDKESMVGNLSFKISGAAQKFFTNSGKTDAYSSFFRSFDLDDVTGTTIVSVPKPILFSGNIEGFFYITNQIAISGGYFYSSDPLIHSYPYFSISYGSN